MTAAEHDTTESGCAPLLEIDDVRVAFRLRGRRRAGPRVFRVLEGVSLTVRPAEVVGVIGESGAGKSTLARVAVGLVRPHQGDVRLLGVDLGTATRSQLRDARRQVHLIYQDPYDSLSPRLPVGQLVAEPLVIHGVPTSDHRARVIDALDAAGLVPPGQFVDRFAGEMSGGQRQRVALARALVLEPKLILADEPTSMLDVSLRAGLLKTMRSLRDERGIAFLFITHDLALARSFCDRLAVMFRGTIVETGPCADVLASPRHPYTTALRAAVRDLAAPRVIPTSAADNGCIYRSRCPWARDDLCSEPPPLRDLASGHAVACHLVGEREPSGDVRASATRTVHSTNE